MLAALMVAATEADVRAAHSALAGSEEACEGTPADTGYAFLLGSLNPALHSSRETAAELGSAMQQAAQAYAMADGSAAAAFKRKKG